MKSIRYRLLSFIALLVALVIAIQAAPTSAMASAAVAPAQTHTYDTSTNAQVDARAFAHTLAGPAQSTGAREWSTSPSVGPLGPPTTSSATFIATEAVPTVRHYTTSEAAESIIKGGEITPGSSGNIWVTPDRYVNGATAQSRLALSRTSRMGTSRYRSVG